MNIRGTMTSVAMALLGISSQAKQAPADLPMVALRLRPAIARSLRPTA